MTTSLLFILLLGKWFWASLTGGAVLIGLVLAVVALRRAAQGARRLAEDLDNSTQQSPLSLFGSALPAETAEPAPPEPLPATEPVPRPVIQMPALARPEPAPTEPLEPLPAAAAAALEEPVESANPSVLATADFALREAETVEAETYTTEENTLEPAAPRSPQNILAGQIAKEIAERRAKLSSSESLIADPRQTEVIKTSEAVENRPVPEVRIAAAKTTPIAPPPSGPVEHLPTAKKRLQPPPSARLQPPSASLAISTTVAGLNVPKTPAPVRAKATEPLSVSELLPTALQTAPLHPGTVQTPVEYFPQPAEAKFGKPAKTPSFLGGDGAREKADISYERRGALKLIAAVGVLALFTVLTFLPTVRAKLPEPVATQLQKIPVKLGVETLPPPPPPPKLVEVREYVIAYKPTESKEVRTALMGGVVKNISANPLQNLRVEVELWRRDGTPATPPELRIVPLDAIALAPGAQGRYILEVPDKDYFSARFVRVLQSDGKVAEMVYNKEKIPAWEPPQNAIAEKKKG